jgi:outer membrane protein assembly factor BamB
MTGEVVWKYSDGASTIPSSVVNDGILFAVSRGVTALKPPTDSASIEQLWRQPKLAPGTGSIIAYRGRIYSINGAGILTSADPKTGDVKWQLRVPGPYSGSPVAAGGHLFVFNEEGKGHCVKLGDEAGEIVATGELGEEFMCTPAISNGAIYVRSDKTLWKIAAK